MTEMMNLPNKYLHYLYYRHYLQSVQAEKEEKNKSRSPKNKNPLDDIDFRGMNFNDLDLDDLMNDL